MIKAKIESLLKSAAGKKLRDVEVFPPDNEKFGHYSTNIALKLSKLKHKNPLTIAEEIVNKISKKAPKNFFEKIEIAPPGFINFWLSETELAKELSEIIKKTENYGKSDAWKGKKVMVEFTDPNPFKEFHIGHLYSNIVGEALSRIFETNGAIVKRANYQGDVGMHVAKAIWGMMAKMKRGKISLLELGKRTLDYRIKFMAESYAKGAKAFENDSKAKIEIAEFNKKIYNLDKEVKDLYKKGRAWSLEYFEGIYKRLGTKFDFYYFERDVGKVGAQVVKSNLKKGIFEESDGAIVFPGEKYGLHRRVFINSAGLPTYEAKELGLAMIKYKDFPCDISVIVTGNEIIDYFKVLIAAIKQIDRRLGEKIKHIPHGMVRLASGKMSSRTGDVIKGEDLLNEAKKRILKIARSPEARNKETAEKVAVGAVKYSLLKGSLGQDIVFDIGKSLSIKGDSAPYIQYTYARLKSILRKAHNLLQKPDFLLLTTDLEKTAMRQLIYFPDAVSRAADLRETNIIADYLFKLANALNSFYESEPILKAPKPLRENRLNLILAATIILKNGLNLLGIKAPEKM